MRFLLTLTLLTVSLSASAASFLLDVNVALGSKPVTHSQILVKENGKATVESDNSFMDVEASTASIGDREGIMLKFLMGEIDKQGKRTNLSNAELLVNENVRAEITKHDQNSKILSLNILAKKI